MRFDPVPWSSIPPKDAVGLNLADDPDIEGPLNSRGEVCPWPWEFQQMAFDPDLSNVHTCSHCGEIGTPGLPHNDFRGVPEVTA